MGRPWKISAAMRLRIIETARKRLEIPTDKELAREAGCTVSGVRNIIREFYSTMSVPRETSKADTPPQASTH